MLFHRAFSVLLHDEGDSCHYCHGTFFAPSPLIFCVCGRFVPVCRSTRLETTIRLQIFSIISDKEKRNKLVDVLYC